MTNQDKILRYTLGYNSEKYTCPQCGKKGRYRRYYDTLSFTYLPNKYGRCDRVNGCGYDLNPYKELDFLRDWEKLNDIDFDEIRKENHVAPIQEVIPLFDIFERCANRPLKSNLYDFFVSKFGKEISDKVFYRYACTPTIDGGDMFWQFTDKGEPTTAKIIYYKEGSHHRDREKLPKWVHSELKKKNKLPQDYNPTKYLYGWKNINAKKWEAVNIVESEKTAMAMYARGLSNGKDNTLWLASGGAANKETIKAAALILSFKELPVTLVPDYDEAGQTWKKLAEECGCSYNAAFIEYCKKNNLPSGTDCADLILK